MAEQQQHQGAYLTVEQRELRALMKQAGVLVQFMTREACEKAIANLLPVVRDAISASEVHVPEGLDEKKGMELIELLIERRRAKTTSASPSRPGPDSAKSERTLVGPPRKQAKHFAFSVEEKDWKRWNVEEYGNVDEIVRLGVHNGTFGVFLQARASGAGHRTRYPFFADASSLKTIDNINEKGKFKKITSVFVDGIDNCLREIGEEDRNHLGALLRSSNWGKRVLAIIENK